MFGTPWDIPYKEVEECHGVRDTVRHPLPMVESLADLRTSWFLKLHSVRDTMRHPSKRVGGIALCSGHCETSLINSWKPWGAAKKLAPEIAGWFQKLQDIRNASWPLFLSNYYHLLLHLASIEGCVSQICWIAICVSQIYWILLY